MSLVADIALEGDLLPLVGVAAAVPHLEVQIEMGRRNPSGPAVMFVRATGQSFDGLTDAFKDDGQVERAALVSATPNDRLYQVFLQEPDVDLTRLDVTPALFERTLVTPDGWRVRGTFPDREELMALRAFAQANDVTFSVTRLVPAGDEGEPRGMTSGQREALLTAFRMGYFEVPRRTSLGEVADELGVSGPALSERLRRAERHLVEQYAETVIKTLST